ncbi:1-deoxy-D-xylulose-5-phosphate synthase N-terminal domain-containing protein [Achromobacter aegrifaciens]
MRRLSATAATAASSFPGFPQIQTAAFDLFINSNNRVFSLLDAIDSPALLRRLDTVALCRIADELRAFIIGSVASTEGHFASYLGTVKTVGLSPAHEGGLSERVPVLRRLSRRVRSSRRLAAHAGIARRQPRRAHPAAS